jgi:serine/threonine-protein kinase RsbT
MAVTRRESYELAREEQIVRARQQVRKWAAEVGLSLVEQTKFVTAASELARNTIIHGGGGSVELELLDNGNKRGLRLTFADEGPGIADIQLALRDGYTTGNGLGLGLGGAKRLVSEFEIESRPGQGTRITITRWK